MLLCLSILIVGAAGGVFLQAKGVVTPLVYSRVASFVLLKIISMIIGLRVPEEETTQTTGCDVKSTPSMAALELTQSFRQSPASAAIRVVRSGGVLPLCRSMTSARYCASRAIPEKRPDPQV